MSADTYDFTREGKGRISRSGWTLGRRRLRRRRLALRPLGTATRARLPPPRRPGL
jgi:hypothetical protein